jgi:hypothetical protein
MPEDVAPIMARAFVAPDDTVEAAPIPTPLLAPTSAPIMATTFESVLILLVSPPKVLPLPMDTTPP